MHHLTVLIVPFHFHHICLFFLCFFLIDSTEVTICINKEVSLVYFSLLLKGSSQRFLEDMKKAKRMSLAENRQLQRSERQLTKNIRTSGLRIRNAIPKDGNCLFHAVADQINRVGERGYDHVGLRALAVNTLKDGLPGVSLQHEFTILILLLK